jgi:hypothetical protein
MCLTLLIQMRPGPLSHPSEDPWLMSSASTDVCFTRCQESILPGKSPQAPLPLLIDIFQMNIHWSQSQPLVFCLI